MNENSIEVPLLASCPFCDYLSGARSFTFVERDDLTAVMVTREQRGLPHLLVTTVAHRETLLDISDAEGVLIMRKLQQAARAIDSAYARPGISVWQSNGVPASQSINHIHFHIAGTNEQGGTNWGTVPELSLDETERISTLIKKHWN